MLDNTNKKILEKTIIQHSLTYPDATIREYLNMRRATKDKFCLIIFLLYSFGMVIMLGVGFFYGNYNTIGIFTNGAATTQVTCEEQKPYVNQAYTSCLSSCDASIYLSAICITSDITEYNPELSSDVSDLILMYDLKYTLPMLSYITIALLFITGILFFLLIYFSKLLYIYILLLFMMLLGFSFYLLKLVQLRNTEYNIGENSIFYTQDQQLRYLAFILLAIYLIIFPFVLFSPLKIKIAIALINGLKQYYKSMLKMHIFTIFIIFICWGCLFLEIFLIINFYSAGEISTQPTDSMFYTFTGINLSHPASLVFHFIGIYWIFVTFISWHKYFINSGLCLWYFQQSQGIYTLRRSLKRSLHHIGSAALDAFLMPIQWILLLIYSITKIDQQNDEEEAGTCITNCLMSLRQFFIHGFSKINTNSPSSAVLTNMNFFQGCTISWQTFSLNSHRLFNIGGTIQIFITIFTVIFWIMISFFILYYEVYNASFPPIVSSINLPMFAVFFVSLVIGTLFSNIFASSVDCLIFCYLIQRKSLIQNGIDQEVLNRDSLESKVKQTLDDCYYRSQQYDKYNKNIYIYQQTDENTLQLNYISRKQ